MARITRVVAAGFPHPITQRGNRRQEAFEGDFDKEAKEIRRPERTGRPLGSEGFVSELEKGLRRTLRYKKPGSKGKNKP